MEFIAYILRFMFNLPINIEGMNITFGAIFFFFAAIWLVYLLIRGLMN